MTARRTWKIEPRHVASSLAAAVLVLAAVGCGSNDTDAGPGLGTSKSETCEEARATVNAGGGNTEAVHSRDELRATYEQSRANLQAIADRADDEGAAALKPWIDGLADLAENATPAASSPPAMTPVQEEQQRQIQRTVEACGWRYNSHVAGWVPADSAEDILDPSASVDVFIQNACIARGDVQQQPNDGSHLRALVPFLRTVEEKAALGLESYPDSDDLRTLRDWARNFAEQADHDQVEMPSDAKESELLFDLSTRATSICDELRGDD